MVLLPLCKLASVPAEEGIHFIDTLFILYFRHIYLLNLYSTCLKQAKPFLKNLTV